MTPYRKETTRGMELRAARGVGRRPARTSAGAVLERLQRSGVSSASSVLLGAGVMVFSLVAYFVSMVAAFAVVMTVLVDFGDSQLRIGRISQPAVSVLAGSGDALTNSEKAREEQKAAEARKVLEAQRAAEKAAEAKENAKKLARARLARERKEATIARQRQERENALAFGYTGQVSNGTAGLYSYAPRWSSP